MFGGKENNVGNKEVRKFMKVLRKECDEFDYKCGNHIKLILTKKNRSGEKITLPPVTLGKTPSCGNWKRIKTGDINRLFRERDIPEIKVIN